MEQTPHLEGKPAPEAFEKEIPLNNGEIIKLPTIHVNKMSLYHGSPIAGITAFEEADQQTIGRGIYFTPARETAHGYARERNKVGTSPTVYQAEASDLDIADLRTRQAQEQFAKLFKQSLLNWEQNVLPNLQGLPEEVIRMVKEERKKAIADLIQKIDSNSFLHLRDLAFGWGDLVSKTLADVGYKGLMSVEGEPPKIDFHDSIVIFDPRDVKIVNQRPAA